MPLAHSPRMHTPERATLSVSCSVPVRYPVVFSRDLFAVTNPVLADALRESPDPLPHRCLVFVDSGLATAAPATVGAITDYFAARPQELLVPAPPQVLPGGEAAKQSFDVVQSVIRLARQHHLSRHAVIVAVGGGAFLDAVGFAAALVHRGVRLVRVPTTVLGQCDSGVGVKNGLNLGDVKNFLGVFAAPAAVLNDAGVLATLADRDWIAGSAEAFKVAIIKDAAFLAWLSVHAAGIPARDPAVMEELVYRCARLHVEHISGAGDPFEAGTARPLDFGHWAAHKLESLSWFELRHGEAVAIGMAIDLLYAAGKGLLPEAEARRVIAAMQRAGLPVAHRCLSMRGPDGRLFVLQGLEEFREHLGGTLHITLPAPLGAKVEVQTMDTDLLTACVGHLLALAPV